MSANEATHEMTVSAADRREEAAAHDAAELLDESAFRAFYDRTARVLSLYLRRITGDAQLADDLLQETYYRFWRAGTAFQSESHRRNSLFRIATNLAHDASRRSRRAPSLSLDSNADFADFAGTDRVASRAEGRADLQKAMAQLKPAQREMLWLAYGLGSSHAEIAETVGVKTGSVKLLLFRARRKLAAILGEPHDQGGRHGAD